MCKGRDDVDSEANKEGPDSGVDRAKEREDDGQEPYWDHHRQPCHCPQAYALCVMHSYHLLPHEVQGSACKPKRNELQTSKIVKST